MITCISCIGAISWNVMRLLRSRSWLTPEKQFMCAGANCCNTSFRRTCVKEHSSSFTGWLSLAVIAVQVTRTAASSTDTPDLYVEFLLVYHQRRLGLTCMTWTREGMICREKFCTHGRLLIAFRMFKSRMKRNRLCIIMRSNAETP